MINFRLTDDQWGKISIHLQGVGRQKSDGDRQALEFIASRFINSRTKLGRGLQTPKKAQKAWLDVAAAAEKLGQAITNLEAAGATDFGFLDRFRGGAAAWAATLPSLIEGAKYIAELEVSEIEEDGTPKRKPANNTDPLRDYLFQQLVGFWVARGGTATLGYDDSKGMPSGPLIDYYEAIIDPIAAAVGESSPTKDVFRGFLRERYIDSQNPSF